jgi:hypothetical protein
MIGPVSKFMRILKLVQMESLAAYGKAYAYTANGY